MSPRVYRGRGGSGVIVQRRDQARQLRIDGTFASWYEPGKVATGSVWDALAVPLLALPPRRRRSVLILGLGGASAARVLRSLAPGAELVGVEISPEVVKTARRWFDLDEIGMRVVVEDARSFLETERQRYDLVIDDIFVGRGRRACKPAWLPEPGLALAARRLLPGGLLVSNALDEAAQVTRTLCHHFPHVLRLELKEYDNRVLVAGASLPTARELRSAIGRSPVLAPTLGELTVRTVIRPEPS